jgi:hypothetical protein
LGTAGPPASAALFSWTGQYWAIDQQVEGKWQAIDWAKVAKKLSIGRATDGDLPGVSCFSGRIISEKLQLTEL